MNHKVTSCTAVFTDDWKWPFNPKDPRSKRQGFLNSGERISGFTAVFCDDWKDYKEDAARVHTFKYQRLESSQHEQWYEGCKRKRGFNDCHNFEFFPECLSTPRLCKRQHRQQSSLETHAATLPPIPTDCQWDESGWLKSDPWLPQSPATLKDLTASSTISEASSQGPATPCYSTLGVPNLSCPIPIDIASQTETGWDECFSSAKDESKIPSSVLTDLTTGGRGGMVPLTEEVPDCHLFQTDEWEMKDKGLDYWSQLLECNTSLYSCRTLQAKGEFRSLRDIEILHAVEGVVS